MTASLAGIVGGVGLLFFGMWWLQERIKAAAGPRIRALSGRLTGNRFAGFFLGALAGAITQSSPATVFIAISMMRSGLISTRQGFLIALGAQLGVSSLILVVAFDIKSPVLYALGLAGIVLVRVGKAHYREAAAMLFGVALIVFSLILVKESADSLAEQPWFQGALEISTRSLLLALLLGAILTFVVQAGLPIIAFGIAGGAAGLVEVDHVIMFIYGAFLGLGLIILAATAGLRGIPRQIGIFDAFIMFFPATILVPSLYVEVYLGVPMVKAGLLSLDIGLAGQMALLVVLYGTPSRIVVLAAPDWTVRLFARFWRTSEIEQISLPRYIHGQALHDAETSLDLAHLEQKRVLGLLSDYLDFARTRRSPDEMRNSVRDLNALVSDFLNEFGQRHPLYHIERGNSMLSRQKLITWLERQVSDLCDALQDMPDEPPWGDFRSSLIEGTHGVFLVFLDALDSDSGDSWLVAEELVADRRGVMQGVRARYSQMQPEAGNRQGGIMEATNAVETIFVLLAQLTQECRSDMSAPSRQ